MTHLAACLCFRDSARYLHEWLLFHRVQGFTRFYLYDNESSDDYQTVLQPWLKSGMVSVRKWPGRAQQQVIYDHCLSVVPQDVGWLAFIDDDEFLFRSDLQPLPALLETFAAHAGVAIPWYVYGSSGIQNDSDEWVIRRFSKRAKAPDPHLKCIVQPSRVVKSTVIGHAFQPVDGFEIVDENFRPVTEIFHPAPTCEKFRINHYIVKSWDELIARRVLRPEANTGKIKPHSVDQWFEWDRTWSEFDDPIAQHFIGAMKIAEGSLSAPLSDS